jgi:hypothetical protein
MRLRCVDDLKKYRAMRVMARVLPNLQQITIGGLEWGHKYNDGDDPDEEHADMTANWTSHDVGIISNFSKLRILEIRTFIFLNGIYPVLFNSFPLLEKLSIKNCHYLKWDLQMLAGFPLLKELTCQEGNYCMTGNISSLRVLKNTLERVTIEECYNVEGNFMDLADFPHLKELNLHGTVTGDIEDIGEGDFPAMEQLILPSGTVGLVNVWGRA